MSDEFGNRMKSYEAVETKRALDPHLPIYARIDGRSFSRFTRGMPRPYSEEMSAAMVETTKFLVAETHARIGYTQSDEISLVWLADGENSDVMFSGKVLKLASVLASMAAAKFARVCPVGYEDRLPHFDCRVFQLPGKAEAANAILWRAMDARKNSISMAAQAQFSPKRLHGKRQSDMLEMLSDIDVEFEGYPGFFKDGSYARRKVVERHLTPIELSAIPPKHRPHGPVMRTEIEVLQNIRFRDVGNRVDFIFDGAPALERAALNQGGDDGRE
jgi:tRNA(His) guanylyltransferase